jgi:integrase/recombinase XerD
VEAAYQENEVLTMRTLKHLPIDLWPPADRLAFDAAFARRDIFDDDRGPGSHLRAGTRQIITVAYRRWLGFLNATFQEALAQPPADRITPDRVRNFVERLREEVRPTTVAVVIENLHYAARLIASGRDWRWLKAVAVRLAALGRPADRFDRLVPPWFTVEHGIALMDAALALPLGSAKRRARQFRDGLLLSLISLWPIRRRSIASLTISRHVEFDDEGVNILLHADDTKSHRPESFRLPAELVPYLKTYLDRMRPILQSHLHDGLWASNKRCPLSAGRIYDIARARIRAEFGKHMCLHDFRRAASTFLAMDAPEKIGLIPGVLQHASPDVSDQHYNLARSTAASRRHSETLLTLRMSLQSGRTREET